MALPHVDYIPDHVSQLKKTLAGQHPEPLERIFQDTEASTSVSIPLVGLRADILSLWRLLKGPNNDWPLALCDCRTVDHTQDAVKNNTLFREDLGKNVLLKHNAKHR